MGNTNIRNFVTVKSLILFMTLLSACERKNLKEKNTTSALDSADSNQVSNSKSKTSTSSSKKKKKPSYSKSKSKKPAPINSNSNITQETDLNENTETTVENTEEIIIDNELEESIVENDVETVTSSSSNSSNSSEKEVVTTTNPSVESPIIETTNYKLAVESDFDGNGLSDILWYNNNTGEAAAWLDGSYPTPFGKVDFEAGYVIAGTGDFNGNGKSDILWYSPALGSVVAWEGGTNPITFGSVPGVLGYKIAGVGDFDGDKRSDILWYSSVSGEVAIWKNGTTSETLGTVPGSWGYVIAGVGDFNGDGKSDILWYHQTSGQVALWYDGQQSKAAVIYTVTPSWGYYIVGTGDFNGDNESDILWSNVNSGQVIIWYSGSNSKVIAESVAPSMGYMIQGIGDFNGDAQSDILWYNVVNGSVLSWKSGFNGNPQHFSVSQPLPTWGYVIAPERTYVGSVPNPGRVAVGNRSVIYDASVDNGCGHGKNSFLDGGIYPTALFKTSNGVRVRIQTHDVSGNTYSVYSDLTQDGRFTGFWRDCKPAYSSHKSASAYDFTANEWLGASYKINSQKIYSGAIHNEYAGDTYPVYDEVSVTAFFQSNSLCSSSVWGKLGIELYSVCGNYVSLTQALSTDGGATFNLIGTKPSDYVIGNPGAMIPNSGFFQGYFSHTNYVRAKDGYYYMIVYDRTSKTTGNNCPARTPDLSQPSLWRAWNGSSFSVDMSKGEHCTAPTTLDGNVFPFHLSYNTYFQAYMLEGSYAGKVSYLLSWDLTNWSAPVDVGIQLWHTGDVPGWTMNNYPTFLDSQHLQNVDSPNSSSSAVTGQFPLVTYVETATSRAFAKRAVARQVYFSK